MSTIKLILFAPIMLLGGCELIQLQCEWVQLQCIALSQHPLSQPLTEAAGKGDISKVDQLISAGAPVEEPYSLQAAISNRQYEMVEHLVGRGGPVNGDGQLQSPLWFAAAHCDTQMVRLLISLGADVNWQTDHMGTPLHAALHSLDREGHRLETVRILLEYNADVNQMQRDKMFSRECLATPLHSAVFSLDEAAIKLLIERGADQGATDQQGRTALQCARERLEVVYGQTLRSQVEGIIALLEAERAVGRQSKPKSLN